MNTRFMLRILAIVVLCTAVQDTRAASSSVTFEAESGTLGADWSTVSGTPAYITITTVGGGENPTNAARVAGYTVTFPAAGSYQLYARVRVGPNGASDDSLFYADGFGVKSPTNNAHWVTVNGLSSVGFTNSSSVVTGGGSVGSGVWKWINLSQFTSQGLFPVSSTNLTQTFQIGAREDGLDMDKFVFGMFGVQYTVSNLDSDVDGVLPPGTATLNWIDARQLIDGFGAGVVFLNGGATFNDANADKLFRSDTTNQLGLTLLRVRVEPNSSWTNSVSGWNGSVNDAKRAALRGAGVLATPWTPPAAMKDNGSLTDGGHLLPGQYANYAAYLEKYASNMLANGVSLRAVSIQNEPDWAPDYESCEWTSAEFLSFFRTNAHVIKSAPVMMPETVGFNFSIPDPSLNDPVAVTNIDFVGLHLYGVNEVNGMKNITPYNNALNKGKRVWQTEYLINDQTMEIAIQTGREIHNCLTTGRMSAYIWWKCVGTANGLLNDSGVIQRRGFVMSQFSRFVRPGHYRIGETNQGSGAVSAYRNPTNNQFAIVAINAYGLPLQQMISLSNFASSVTLTPWITSATQSLATMPAFDATNGSFNYTLPPNSIVTFAGETAFGSPGQATNPSPTNGATGVVVGSALSWTPGSNAVTHAVYLGVNSNTVAQATTSSAEFQGTLFAPSFIPSLVANQTYYWRVDEIAGANTNAGIVWSFSAVPAPALAHRYSFSELSGTTVADTEGGPAWDGTLPSGGTFASGRLTLASASSQYIGLPTGIVSTLSNFTIEAWVRLDSTADWVRIFDFGNSATVNMFLTPQNGVDDQLRFAITTGGTGGEQQINTATTMSTGSWHHVVVTLNGNTGILYLNGAPVGTNSTMTLRPTNLGSTANNYLGRSQYSNDPYLNATLDEFRIYSVPLSAAEVAATDALGPDQLLSTNSPVLSLTTTPTTLTLAWPLASAGFAVQSRTNLVLGNWVNVTSPVPQIIGGHWEITLPVSANAPSTFYQLLK
jgi:glucuronoarabinoxylan endo-1,4-beta-xylanase